MIQQIHARFDQATAAMAASRDTIAPAVAQAADTVIRSLRAGGGVMVFGNGGSAADAQHIAAELVGRFMLERRALRAQALGAEGPVLTSLANDYEFSSVFARQIQAGGRPGDVAWALSTSGNSPNVVRALEAAREIGMATIVFSAGGGGRCGPLADVLVDVPGGLETPRIQEVHAVAYHVVCELVEAALA